MHPVDTQPQRFTQHFDIYAQIFSGRSMETTSVAANRQEQKDITIYTDEGDKVTLAFEAADQLVYSEYQGQSHHAHVSGMQNVAAIQVQSVNVEQKTIEFDRQRAFTITVEGDRRTKIERWPDRTVKEITDTRTGEVLERFVWMKEK